MDVVEGTGLVSRRDSCKHVLVWTVTKAYGRCAPVY